MARLPTKEDLKAIDQALGDITTKLDNISKLSDAFEINPAPWDDVANRINAIAKVNKKWAETIKKVSDSRKTIQASVKKELDYQKKQNDLANEFDKKAKKQGELYNKFNKYRQDLIEKQNELIKGGEKESRAYQSTTKELLKTEKELHAMSLQQDAYLKEWNEVQDSIKGSEKSIEDLYKKEEMLPGPLKTVGKLIGGEIAGAADKLGKGLIDVGLDAFFGGLKLVETGLKNVYEYFEKWQHLLGDFNKDLGGTSKNIKANWQEGKVWEAEIRSLGGEFGEGMKMYQDFLGGFEQTGKATKEFRKLGLDVAQGMNLGGQAAGELVKAMRQVGDSSDEVRHFFVDIKKNADKAGISVNKFAKEISESRSFVTQFGKAARTTFLQGAGWVRSMGISLRSLENFTKLTDTFDGTAEAAAKMNTVFGTSMNALQLTMEEDPAKRLDLVRNALKGQGIEFDKMSRRERAYMAQTIGLSEEDLDGVMKSKKGLNEYMATKEKAKKKELSDAAELKKMTMATQKTLFNFSQAFDQITKALADGPLKPLTDWLGLTGELSKKNTSFGEKMKGIFNDIGDVIKNIGQSKALQNLFGDATVSLQDWYDRVMKYLKGPEFQKTFDSVVEAVGKIFQGFRTTFELFAEYGPTIEKVLRFLVDNSGTLLAIWGGAKLFSGVSSVVTAFGSLTSVLGMTGPALLAAAAPLGAVALAIGGVGAAVYELIKHWGDLKQIFHEGIDWKGILGGPSEAEINRKADELGQQAINRRHAAEAAAKTAGTTPTPTSAINSAPAGPTAAAVPTAPAAPPIPTSIPVREPNGNIAPMQPTGPAGAKKDYGTQAKKGAQAPQFTLVAGDVYLDGHKIGTHMVKTLTRDQAQGG